MLGTQKPRRMADCFYVLQEAYDGMTRERRKRLVVMNGVGRRVRW